MTHSPSSGERSETGADMSAFPAHKDAVMSPTTASTAPVEVAHRRLSIEGVRLHYRVAGRGRSATGGTPVVCLAAPGQSSSSLTPLLKKIGSRRLCFALDLPGHGRSGNPPFARRDPSWWLTQWLERMQFEKCHLVTVDGSVGVAIDTANRS